MKKTVLLLHYCGWHSSRYFILMQYKLKMLQFIPNTPSIFSGQWAMPIPEWFILLSQFCSKAWSNQLANQWIGSRITNQNELVREYIYIYIYICIYIRGVTVHVFVPNRFGTDLSVRYACVPNNTVFIFLFFQDIQIINGILTVFDVAWQISV